MRNAPNYKELGASPTVWGSGHLTWWLTVCSPTQRLTATIQSQGWIFVICARGVGRTESKNHFRAFRSLPYYKRPQEVQPQTSSARLCPAGLEGAGAAGTWGLLSGNSLVYSGKASKPAHADRKHRAQESVLQAAREAASSANRHLLLGYRRKTRTPPLVPQAAFCLELSRQLHRQSLICSITNQVTPRSAFSTEPQQRDLAALPPPTLRLPPPGAAHAPAVPSSRRAGQWPAGQRCQKMAAARARGHRGRHRRAGERPGRFVWR